MNKEDKARYLFEQLGDIDDDLLYESSGRPLMVISAKQKRKKRARTLALLLAASVAVSLVMITFSSRVNHAPGDSTPPETNATGSAGVRPEEEPLSEGGEHDVLFSGTPCVIVEEASGERYFYRMDQGDFEQLRSLTARNVSAPGVTAARKDKIWFTDGRGTVVSPCIRFTEGNVGYGALFDYEDEVDLSAELRSALSRLTGGNVI